MATKDDTKPARDFEVHAEIIKNSADEAAKAIVARRAALDKEGQQDKPLVIIAGERHNNPVYYIERMSLVNTLRQTGESITNARETDHTFIYDRLSLFTKSGYIKLLISLRQLPYFAPALVQEIEQKLHMMEGWEGTFHASPTEFSFLMKHGIRTLFADAATINDDNEFLDITDRSTRESMQACLGPKATRAGYITEKGIYVRNHHMVKKGMEEMKVRPARYLLQQCGRGHMFEKTGLAALFKSMAGYPVLTIADPNTYRGLQEHEIYVRTLPKVRCNYEIPDEMDDVKDEQERAEAALVETNAQFLEMFPEALKPFDLRLSSHQDESIYVNGILRRMGMEDECLPISKLKDLRMKYNLEIKELLSECERAWNPAPTFLALLK